MSKAYVEIDFFEMEKRNNASSKSSSPERAPSSFRGIQNVVSRINPQLLKTVMAAGHARHSDNVAAWPTSSNPSSPSRTASPPPLPVLDAASRCSHGAATDVGVAPLTIFYNGTVHVFDVPREKAEAIMRMAETGVFPTERPVDSSLDGNQLEGDMPMTRRKSLQRFLSKRKERFALASPYHKVSSSGPC